MKLKIYEVNKESSIDIFKKKTDWIKIEDLKITSTLNLFLKTNIYNN